MDDVRETISANNRKFSDAFLRGDAAAIAALYTDDARLLPPAAPPMRGKEAIENFWRGAMGMGIKEAWLETVDVETGGELACETGQFTLVMETDAGERAEQTGKYVVVWKRAGAEWKLHVDIWNTNAPA